MDVSLTVTVIICAYTLERWSALIDAMESVDQQTQIPHQIVLVVDHNDQLLERAMVQFETSST